MAIRHYKKISELDAITSASLSTYVAGVDNGQTVRITLDVLADGVRNTINTIDIQRLNALEAVTGSYLTSLNGAISGSSQLTSSYDERYVISGSLTQTTWDNISGKPNGLISQSTDLSHLNSFTSSQNTLNTAFTNAISARLQTTTYNTDSASFDARIIAATNEQSFNGLISGSSQLTSSFDQRYVLSGSITQTTWDNIANKPNDIVSSSTQIADLGFVTGSYAYLTEFNSLTQSFNIISGSVVNITNAVDVTQLNNTTASLNNFTSSYYTDSASFNSRIIAATNEQDLSALNSFTSSQSALNVAFTNGMNGRLQTSSFNEFSASIHTEIVAATNEQSLSHLVTTSSFNSFTQSYNTDSSSFDTRINAVSSGSISVINDIIYNGETFTIQKGTPLYVSGSQGANPKVYVADASNPNKMPVTYIAGANINSNNTGVGILLGDISGIDLTGYQPGQQVYVAEGGGWSINPPSGSNSIKQFLGVIVKEGNGGKGLVLNPGPATLPNLQTGYLWVGNTNNQATTIASSSFIQSSQTSSMTAGFSTYASNVAVVTTGTTTDSTLYPVFTINSASNGYAALRNHSSGSYYFDGVTRKLYAESFVGSIEATNGVISGSSQLTSSYDSRYSLSGSVLTSFSQSVDNRLDTLETSIITGSVNYVQVLGNTRSLSTIGADIVSGSITTTGNPIQIIISGDANPTTGAGQWCSLKIYRDGTALGNAIQVEAANINENQAYSLNIIDTPTAGAHTYSLRMVTNSGGTFQFGEAAGPVLTALELNTNTNLPSTNNTFTGDNTFKGALNVFNGVGSGGSLEGGEVDLGFAQSTTLTGSFVAVDVYGDKVRIFEGGGNARGVNIDLSKAPIGVSGELIWKTSGYVNAGTFVQLDNLKVSVTTGGNRGLSVGAVSTSFIAQISGHYFMGGPANGGNAAYNVTYTTTASASAFGWSFGNMGDTSIYIINDTTNSRVYRVTLMIGPSYNNNFISIERLY